MQQQVEIPTEQAQAQGKGLLLSTTEEIFQTRISSSDIKEYNGYKITEFSIFKTELEASTAEDIWSNYPGLIGESLFFLSCKQNGIPVTISSGKEDWEGIDFYVFGYPVDVTTSYARGSIQRKVDAKRCPTLFLPRFIGNNTIYKKPEKCIPYTQMLFDTGSIDTARYIDEMLQINYEIQEIIENEVYLKNQKLIHPKKAGMNNLHNMRTIMALISSLF